MENKKIIQLEGIDKDIEITKMFIGDYASVEKEISVIQKTEDGTVMTYDPMKLDPETAYKIIEKYCKLVNHTGTLSTFTRALIETIFQGRSVAFMSLPLQVFIFTRPEELKNGGKKKDTDTTTEKDTEI